MLQQMHVYKGGGYNELIFEWDAWVERLPGALEAFFLRPESSAAQRAEAYAQRAAFISEYGLKEGGSGTPPMLMYDKTRKSAPFLRVDEWLMDPGAKISK